MRMTWADLRDLIGRNCLEIILFVTLGLLRLLNSIVLIYAQMSGSGVGELKLKSLKREKDKIAEV